MRITRQGYEKLLRELQTLRVNQQKNFEIIQEARSHGDLRENAAYGIARFEGNSINERMIQIDNILRNIKIVEPQPVTADTKIQFGSLVTVTDKERHITFKCRIIGAAEVSEEDTADFLKIFSEDNDIGSTNNLLEEDPNIPQKNKNNVKDHSLALINISEETPMALAMIGKEKNDTFSYHTRKVSRTYKIDLIE